MSFDFSQFAKMNTNELANAFGFKQEEETFSAPDVDTPDINDIKDGKVNLDEKPNDNLNQITPEQIKAQAEFLKQQKEKMDAKDNVKDNNGKKEKENNKAKKNNKKDASTKDKSKKEGTKKENIIYSRPRKVLAYGDEIYQEVRPEASLEDIRKELVTTYGFSEFKDKDRCEMKFDIKTGEVYPEISFKKKG